MKKLKYIIAIIVICLLVFIGVELLSQNNTNNQNTLDGTNTNTSNENIENENIENENTTNETNTDNAEQNNPEETPVIGEPAVKDEITTGEELLEQAEKTLTARGWAGSSNNIIGLKDETIYFYNRGTGEFYKIATGITDIEYSEDDPEIIIATKNSNSQELGEKPMFLEYE